MSQSIGDLLVEGKFKAEMAAKAERQSKERQAERALNCWDQLVVLARDQLGDELADTSTPRLTLGEPPPSFTGHSESIRLQLRPFGAGRFSVAYLWLDRFGPPTILCKTGTIFPQCTVEQGYFYGQEPLTKEGGVRFKSEATVFSLAEAVYLCSLQTQGYQDALKAVPVSTY